MPPILFVTSFSPDLYAASGWRLLETFRVVEQPGYFLVCHEGEYRPPLHRRIFYNGPRFLYEDLDGDAFLQDWLRANRDVIPAHLGGTTEMCGCPDANIRHGRKHVQRCHWSWMNRNASRWFRKVAALRRGLAAADRLGTPWLVWLDADVYFCKAIPLGYFEEKLKVSGLLHFRGHRPATESGILGIQLNQGGREFVEALCQRYTSRDYLKYERWDDGFQIARLVDEGAVKALDLVHPTKYLDKTDDVIPTTDITEFLRHSKGRHGTFQNIML